MVWQPRNHWAALLCKAAVVSHDEGPQQTQQTRPNRRGFLPERRLRNTRMVMANVRITQKARAAA
jgi:hypothetical protein